MGGPKGVKISDYILSRTSDAKMAAEPLQPALQHVETVQALPDRVAFARVDHALGLDTM